MSDYAALVQAALDARRLASSATAADLAADIGQSTTTVGTALCRARDIGGAQMILRGRWVAHGFAIEGCPSKFAAQLLSRSNSARVILEQEAARRRISLDELASDILIQSANKIAARPKVLAHG